MFLMDSMTSHINRECIKYTLAASAKVTIIPGDLTKKLQPLDIGINRSFKSKVKNIWKKWMTDENHSFTKGAKCAELHMQKCADGLKRHGTMSWKKLLKNLYKRQR